MFRPPCQRRLIRAYANRARMSSKITHHRQLQDPLARLRLRTLPHQALPVTLIKVDGTRSTHVKISIAPQHCRPTETQIDKSCRSTT